MVVDLTFSIECAPRFSFTDCGKGHILLPSKAFGGSMKTVFLAALGVGGATILGTLVGFLLHHKICKHAQAVDAFSAGLMLVAAVMGLIVPSITYMGVCASMVGIFCGAAFLIWCDRWVPLTQKLFGAQVECGKGSVMLLFTAIAVHNFPEGMAAGVGFGCSQTAQALLIAAEIAIQNLPEGMVIIGPLLASGISKRRTLCLGLFTAWIEIIGVVVGYYAASIAYILLPFTLSFSGGMMLFVVVDEMIPGAKEQSGRYGVSLFFLLGFCIMCWFNSVF